MILSDKCLLQALKDGQLSIIPSSLEALQPSSIDLRLASKFRVFDNTLYTHIDPRDEQPGLTSEVDKGTKPFILHPGEFVIGSTYEKVIIGSSMSARIEGKSSNGRLGIQVHSTAGVIDPGFRGNITLELSNVARLPVILWPGMWIAQLTVFMMTSSAIRPYGHPDLNSKYQEQVGPTASRAHLM